MPHEDAAKDTGAARYAGPEFKRLLDAARRSLERTGGDLTRTVTVKSGAATTVSWPTNHYGYYDVVITANTTDGFRRRYAGRIA